MTLSPKLDVVEISTLCHFRLLLPIQMFIKVASSPILSGIGMPSPILWSHSLKMQRIVLLSSLLWWELGTNSLITGPGEWLSFLSFTSKLSWSWSWFSNSLPIALNFSTFCAPSLYAWLLDGGLSFNTSFIIFLDDFSLSIVENLSFSSICIPDKFSLCDFNKEMFVSMSVINMPFLKFADFIW